MLAEMELGRRLLDIVERHALWQRHRRLVADAWTSANAGSFAFQLALIDVDGRDLGLGRYQSHVLVDHSHHRPGPDDTGEVLVEFLFSFWSPVERMTTPRRSAAPDDMTRSSQAMTGSTVCRVVLPWTNAIVVMPFCVSDWMYRRVRSTTRTPPWPRPSPPG